MTKTSLVLVALGICSLRAIAEPAAEEYDFSTMVQPVPATAKMTDPDYNIWCGTEVKGDDGKYNLFYSRWPRKLGHVAWVTNSEVAHAIGDTPFGPWTFHDVALPARGALFWDGSCTHNPTIVRIGKKFYLYYMGNYGDGVVRQTAQLDASKSPTHWRSCGRFAQWTVAAFR